MRELEKLEDQLEKVATTIASLKKADSVDWKQLQACDSKLYYLRVALGFVILNHASNPST
jgi:hypothetical protein